MASIRYLEPPTQQSRQFNKNYLDKFVIEFRFPALLEIELGGQPVPNIQKAIRSNFPHYSKSKSKNLTPLGQFDEVIHKFLDKNRVNVISLSNSSISFSTSKYTNFADAENYCKYLIKTIVPHLQTDFFTRVGMRYVNKLTIENRVDVVNSSINNELTVSTRVLGSLVRFKSEYAGKIDENTDYLFRCGVSDEQNTNNPIDFVLDFDYSQRDVKVDSVLALLNTMHEKHFNFFWWSLGKKAREDLENA